MPRPEAPRPYTVETADAHGNPLGLIASRDEFRRLHRLVSAHNVTLERLGTRQDVVLEEALEALLDAR